MGNEKNNLFTPFKIGNLEIKNRIVMPPMCMYSSNTDDGFVTDWHIQHYSTRAIGGCGLIIVEATAILPHVAMISDNDLGIWSDEHIEGLKKLVDAVHANGAKIGIQLNHAGRKCGSKKASTTYAPSAIRFSDEFETPNEMSIDDIKYVTDNFILAVERAIKAGFDTVEIHSAHGYLISSFLSPLSNKREDEYGKNRVKFLEDILIKIKEKVNKDYPIIIRISAFDWKEGGNTPSDFIQMLKPLEDKKLFDAINVSSGAVVSDAKIIPYEGYQIPFARELKNEMSVPCIGGGLIIDYKMANTIIRNGACDAIYIGRELLRNPYWALQASRALNIDIDYFPKQYEMSKRL